MRDLGSAIATEDLPRVFGRFYRSTAAQAHAGYGRGLAIVSHVAEACSGRAFAASPPEADE